MANLDSIIDDLRGGRYSIRYGGQTNVKVQQRPDGTYSCTVLVSPDSGLCPAEGCGYMDIEAGGSILHHDFGSDLWYIDGVKASDETVMPDELLEEIVRIAGEFSMSMNLPDEQLMVHERISGIRTGGDSHVVMMTA